MAEALTQVAREWVKADATVLTELTCLTGKVPMPLAGPTDKNNLALRQFDDPDVVRRLHSLPGRLWAQVKRDPKRSFRTLAKAQAALGIGMLIYLPIRLENLTALEFGVHLLLQQNPKAISSLVLAADRIPRSLSRPRFSAGVPTGFFVRADGKPKGQATVAYFITTYLSKQAGIVLTAHQFRHLNAKVILDAEPGSFETVKQLLGHKSLKTTVGFYTGISSRPPHAQLDQERARADGEAQARPRR